MIRTISLFALLALSATAGERPGSRVSLSRTLTIFRCDRNEKCTKVAKEDGPANFTAELEKRKDQAPHGEEKFQVEVDGSPFKAEIYLNEVHEGISIYSVLRSGPTTKRHGVTKRAVVNPVHFPPIVLEDKLFRAGDNTFRAKLVVSPIR